MKLVFPFLACAALILAAAPVAEQEPPARPWSNTTELGYVLTTGNAESSSLNFGNKYLRKWDKSEFGFDVTALRAETTDKIYTVDGDNVLVDEDKRTTAEMYTALARFRRDITPRFYWYLGAGWLQNEIAGIDSPAAHVALRLGWDTAAPGFGIFEFLCRYGGLDDLLTSVARERGFRIAGPTLRSGTPDDEDPRRALRLPSPERLEIHRGPEVGVGAVQAGELSLAGNEEGMGTGGKILFVPVQREESAEDLQPQEHRAAVRQSEKEPRRRFQPIAG